LWPESSSKYTARISGLSIGTCIRTLSTTVLRLRPSCRCSRSLAGTAVVDETFSIGPLVVSRDFFVHHFRIVAKAIDNLRPAFESTAHGLFLGRNFLLRIDPIPARANPIHVPIV